MADYTDTFDRADNADLGADWTPVSGHGGFKIDSNAATPSSFLVDSGEVYSAQTFADDQYAEAPLGTIAGTGDQTGVGVLVRGSTSVESFYWAVVNAAGSNNVSVHKFVSGSATLLAQRTQAFSTGDTLRLEVRGAGASTVLRVLRNGVQLGADIADASGSQVASGIPGIAYSGNVGGAVSVQSWGGGDLPVPEVNYDAATESVRTATTDPWTFSHTGRADASGGVQGVVLVAIHGSSSTDHITGAVTYGGVALSRVVTAADTATEPGRADIWFVGSGLSGKGGTQTVSVDLASATGDDFEFVCLTLFTDDGSDIEVIDFDSLSGDQADPSVTLGYTSRFGIAIAGLYGGGAAPTSFTPNGNCTEVASQDLGNFYAYVLRQTTPGTADFAIGGTAISDDVAYVAAAFSKIVSVATKALFPYIQRRKQRYSQLRR